MMHRFDVRLRGPAPSGSTPPRPLATLPRQILALVLVCVLVPLNGSAQQAEPVGTVVSSHAASSGGTVLTAGRTIFAGDAISTGPGGSAQIAVGGAGMVTITQGSTARIIKEAGQLKLEVSQGSAWFCLSNKPLEGKLADAVIHSLDGQAAIGNITMKNASTGTITAEKGRLVISTARNGKSIVLEQGQCVDVTIQTLPPSAANPVQTGVLSNKTVAVLGTVTILAITFAAGLHHENKPDDTTKKNAISPFRFP